MIWDYIQIFPDRPAEDGRREEQGDKGGDIGTVECDDVGGSKRQAQPLKNPTLDNIVCALGIHTCRIGPTPEMTPHVADLPVAKQFQQRCDQVRASLRLRRDSPEAGV